MDQESRLVQSNKEKLTKRYIIKRNDWCSAKIYNVRSDSKADFDKDFQLLGEQNITCLTNHMIIDYWITGMQTWSPGERVMQALHCEMW